MNDLAAPAMSNIPLTSSRRMSSSTKPSAPEWSGVDGGSLSRPREGPRSGTIQVSVDAGGWGKTVAWVQAGMGGNTGSVSDKSSKTEWGPQASKSATE